MNPTKNARPDFDTRIITPVFRLSYPNVFTAKFNQLAKREEFSIQMLFDKATAKTDLAAMVKLVNEIIAWKGWTGAAGIKKPFVDGNTKAEKNPAYKDMILVSSWSKQQPGVVDATGKHPIAQQDEVYGGMYARAQLNAYAYDQAGQRGVNFGLMHLQKIKDGEPFGNRTKAEDAFSPVADAGSPEVDDNGMFG